MLALTSVIDYTFKNVFQTFYILQAGSPIVAGPGVTYPLLSHTLDGLGALTMHFKKITQCANALKTLMLQQLQ